MKVNLNKPVLDYSGEVINLEGKEFTYKQAIFSSLTAVLDSDKGSSAEDKLSIYKLTAKVAADEHDFTIDEIKLMQDRIAQTHTPLVYGRVVELFDN